HAVYPWLQPKQDGACTEPAPGPDARVVRAVFLVSAPPWSARGRVQRTPADRYWIDLHARHQTGFTLLASSVADVGDEHRYRIVHRTDDVCDHDDRARRQAGSGLRGQRCKPGNRCRAWHRARRLDAGRAVCEDVDPQPDRISEI